MIGKLSPTGLSGCTATVQKLRNGAPTLRQSCEPWSAHSMILTQKIPRIFGCAQATKLDGLDQEVLRHCPDGSPLSAFGMTREIETEHTQENSLIEHLSGLTFRFQSDGL